MNDTLTGFDGADDPVGVVVLARRDGGPWQIVDHDDSKRDPLAHAVHLAERFAAHPDWATAITDWTREHAAQPLTTDQQAQVAELFARLIEEGHLACPRLLTNATRSTNGTPPAPR